MLPEAGGLGKRPDRAAARGGVDLVLKTLMGPWCGKPLRPQAHVDRNRRATPGDRLIFHVLIARRMRKENRPSTSK